MKKFLAIFLALMMVMTVALVSCKKAEDPNEDGDNWDNEDVDNGSDSGSDSDSSSDSGSDSSSDSGNNAGNNNNTNAWIDKNDKVYVGMDNTNLREGPGSSYKKALQVMSGTELTRLSTNGIWDKVKYQDVEYYVDCNLVTANGKDFKFGTNLETPVNLTINEGMQINLRTTPFVSDSDDYLYTNVGKSGLTSASISVEKPLQKVAVSENGVWYKVTYDGGTYFIKARLATNGTISDPTVQGGSGSGNVGGIG